MDVCMHVYMQLCWGKSDGWLVSYLVGFLKKGSYFWVLIMLI